MKTMAELQRAEVFTNNEHKNENTFTFVFHEELLPKNGQQNVHNVQCINNLPSTSSNANDDLTKRRTSSRSIRRKKFDDELVESSLSKSNRAKYQAVSYLPPASVPSTSSTKTFMEAHIESRKRKHRTSFTPQRNEEVVVANSFKDDEMMHSELPPATDIPSGSSTKTFMESYMERKKTPTVKNYKKKVLLKKSNLSKGNDGTNWKPSDDLLLILSVQQANDLNEIALGVEFSSKFSYHEIEERWRTLLYDAEASISALSAIRNMPKDETFQIRQKVLFSKEEESILESLLKMNCSKEEFNAIIEKNKDRFLYPRTKQSIFEYLSKLKKYNMFTTQIREVKKFTGAKYVDDFDLPVMDVPEEDIRNERDVESESDVAKAFRNKEVRQLENEVTKWDAIAESLCGTGSSSEETDISTVASLKGQAVNYIIQSQQATIGRPDDLNTVDIDLSLEGPAMKISRKQGIIKMEKDGSFFLINEGKRPFLIDGKPVFTNEKYRIVNNSVIEICGLQLTFHINVEGVNHMKKELNKKK